MANRSLEALKAYFFEHAYPTWQQFHDVLDSFRHKNDKIPITDVDGLANQLNGKASTEEVNSGRIASSTIDGNGHLILTLQDGSQLDAGLARGLDVEMFWESSKVNIYSQLHPRWSNSVNNLIFGTDLFGYSALPGGSRYSNGQFNSIGMFSKFLTITVNNGWFKGYEMNNTTNSLYWYNTMFNDGLSVRLVRAATNMEMSLLDGHIISNAYIDYDENSYSGCKINDKIWLTSNLKVTHYTDGSLIPTGLNDLDWQSDLIGAMSTYPPFDELTSEELVANAYGRLYNYFAATSLKGLVNAGSDWRIQSEEDALSMINYILSTDPNLNIYNIGEVLKSKHQQNIPIEVISEEFISPIGGKKILSKDIYDLRLESRFYRNLNYRYFGSAVNGSLESDSVWNVKRILLNSNGTISVSFATDVKWSDKLTTNYI